MRPRTSSITKACGELIDGFGSKATIGRDLAAKYGEKGRGIAVELELVIARDGCGIERFVLDERAHACVAPYDVGGADLLREVAIDHGTQITNFFGLDVHRGRVAMVFDVGGANQRELLLVGNRK